MSTSAPVARSNTKLILFAVFLALTAFVTFMKNRQAFDGRSDMALHYAPANVFLILHATFASVALLAGVFQFSNRLRARYLKVHKIVGYVYVVCVFIGAPLAIPIAMRIETPSLIASTFMQTFGWIVTTAIGLYCIRSGNMVQHRRWMIRGYPFAMVFTVTRLIIPIPPILALGNTGIEIVVWSTVAMAAFLPSILLEWRAIFPRGEAAKAATRGAAATAS